MFIISVSIRLDYEIKIILFRIWESFRFDFWKNYCRKFSRNRTNILINLFNLKKI